MKNLRLLILILLVATLFRFFHLTTSPLSLNWDEASIGYNAYSIGKTARDEWGKFLPLSFQAFGESKLPGMIYASVPGIMLFGLNEFGLRVTPAVIGVLSVYLLYLLGKKLFQSETLGLLSASLLAVSPWAVHFSRVSFEAGLAMLLTLFAIYSLLLAREQPRYYWHAGLSAILAAYTYNSARILIPLLLIYYLFNKVISFTARSRHTLIRVFIVGLLLTLPITMELARPEGRVRWGTLSIANQKSFVDDIAESRGYTTLPSIIPRLIHNKPTHYAYKLFHNYISTFSTEFLFISGSANTQRSVQGMGLLYLFELPLLVIGLFEISRNKKYLFARNLIIPWLLLAPIPSALTIDAPSSVRTLALLPALLLIEAIGARLALAWLRSKQLLVRTLVAAFVIWNISYFAYQLWLVYPVKYADDWAYGYKQAYAWVFANYETADNIYITSKFGEPHIFALFYGQIDPAEYHQLDIKYEKDPLGWIHVTSFGKFHFTGFSGLETPEEIVARNPGTNLMVTGFSQLPSTMPRDLEVKAPNWKVMFEGTMVEGRAE